MKKLLRLLVVGGCFLSTANCGASMSSRSENNTQHSHGPTQNDHGPGHGHGHGPGHGHGDGHGHGNTMPHRFDDIERWVADFESAERTQWQQPDQVITWLNLTPSSVVADIGSGTGYFSVRIGPRVPQGRVWAIDLEPAMVRYVNQRTRQNTISNVYSILAQPDDPMIPELCDVILTVNTWHHIENRVQYGTRLANYLKPQGKLVIVDFQEQSPVGPPPELRLSSTQVISELTQAHFTLSTQHTLPNQYVLVFTR